MKYYTKQWYIASQCTNLYQSLKFLKAAEQFDEAIYTKLYNKKLQRHINFHETLFNTPPFNVFSAHLIPLESIVDLSHIPDDRKITIYPTEEYKHDLASSIKKFENRETFDVESEVDDFYTAHHFEIERCKSMLPTEILNNIADIRLYALGYCTKRVFKLVKAWNKHNQAFIESVSERARADLHQQPIPKHIHQALRFHDYEVIDFIQDKDLTLVFNKSGRSSSPFSVTFTDAEVLLHEEGINNNYWLYNELYKIENGYELHILFHRGHSAELIIRFTDILSV